MEELRRLPQLRLVVYHILYKVYISQVVVWDFLEKNSMNVSVSEIRKRGNEVTT